MHLSLLDQEWRYSPQLTGLGVLLCTSAYWIRSGVIHLSLLDQEWRYAPQLTGLGVLLFTSAHWIRSGVIHLSLLDQKRRFLHLTTWIGITGGLAHLTLITSATNYKRQLLTSVHRIRSGVVHVSQQSSGLSARCSSHSTVIKNMSRVSLLCSLHYKRSVTFLSSLDYEPR